MLILGGGFAGRNAAQALSRHGGRDVSVRLVDQKGDSEFSPLYPDVVSGRISPSGIRQSLEEFCRPLKVQFAQAVVTGIDLGRRLVATTAGELSADFLVLCLGCRTNFYGNQNMRQHALEIKSIADALDIRQKAWQHIQSLYDRDERFHLVVVGGGYTGIEVASQLEFLLRRQTHLSWERLRRIAAVIVLERAGRVLEMISPGIAEWVVRHIKAYDIEIRTGVTADRFAGPGLLQLTDGSVLPNAIVVWAAGVAPGPACASLAVPKAPQGRLAVDEFLRLPGHEQVFVAGDVAGAIPPGRKRPLRMGVQFSRVAGMVAARNVLATIRGRKLKVFDPFDPGYVVPLAHGLGVGKVLGVECHGQLPYYLHYFMSTYRSWTWPNRVAVLKDLLDLPPPRAAERQPPSAPADDV